MLTVHHLGVSQSERIPWLCEEIDVPYRLIRYERDPVTRMAPPDYKALHPFGTAPVIEDEGMVLGESGAIMDYILARWYGSHTLRPAPDSPNYPHYLFWYHFANASMMPAEMGALMVGALGGDPQNPMAQVMRDRSDRAWTMLERRLGDAPYLAGEDFSAADIIMLFPLTTMRAFVPRDLGPYPNVRAYLQRVGGRDAYRRAMAKAEPDMKPMLS